MLFPDHISYEDLLELIYIRHRTYLSLEERERMNDEWAKAMREKYFKRSCCPNNLSTEDIVE